jgi:hypothetical protein
MSRIRPASSIFLTAVSLLAALAAGGCLYGFSGGGGLPPDIHTVYVPPVQNQTTRFELTQQLTQGLLDAVRGRLGAQLGSQGDADAVIRTTITNYIDQAVSFQGRQNVGAQVFQRRVTVTASVEIVDLHDNKTIWSSSAVTGSGEYAPDKESDQDAIKLALDNLIQKVVDGAQSQW